jgi:uncharacterized peroxidase-related enzyme
MTRPAHDFTLAPLHWSPRVTPIDLASATDEQRHALQVTPSNTKVSDYVLVLAHDPESLSHRTPLFNEIMYGRDGLSRAERELGALAASVFNRCIYCARVHADRFVALSQRSHVVETASRRPEGLRKAMAAAKSEHGKAGPQAVGAASRGPRLTPYPLGF